MLQPVRDCTLSVSGPGERRPAGRPTRAPAGDRVRPSPTRGEERTVIRAASIVVGVDGSPESLTAAEWAAAEAAATDASLVVCHVVPVLAPDAPEPGPGAQIAHLTAERARAAAPRLPVEELILAGATSAELLVEAAEARLLVVGKARTDRRAGTRSVGEQLAAYLTAPMVVVPGAGGLPLPSDAPVTVGVDRSAAEATLGFAFEYASRHRR